MPAYQCKAWGVPAVTTSSKAARIQGYASIDTFPDLTKEEVAAIDAAGRGHHYRFYNHHVSCLLFKPRGKMLNFSLSSR